MKIVHAIDSRLTRFGNRNAHSRVRASSRFRIARQTAESAACSPTSSVSSRFDSPTARSARAPAIVLRVDRRLLSRRRDAGPSGQPPSACGTCTSRKACESRSSSVLRRFHASLGQRPRGLDPGRVVERGEGVQRRAGRGGPHAAGLPVRDVEHVGRPDGPPPERVEAASIEVLARGGRVGEVALLGDGERLPDRVGLIGIDRAAADPRVEQAGRTPAPSRAGSATTSGTGSPARYRRFSRSRARCSGVTRLDCRYVALVTISRCMAFMLQPRVAELDGQPVEQLAVDRVFALDAEVLGRLHDPGAEGMLPHPVDLHAGGQRVLGHDEPAGEPQAIGGRPRASAAGTPGSRTRPSSPA